MKSAEEIRRVLSEEGVFVSTSVGVSMWPMLRSRRDTIVIEPLRGRLKKFDVPLYHRNGKLILHRVIRVCPEGYDIRGDNCIGTEKNVPESCILGVLTGFWRGEKKVELSSFSYRCYVRVWHFVFPCRLALKKMRAYLKAALARAKRLFHKKNTK